jgi:hypothetical protein
MKEAEMEAARIVEMFGVLLSTSTRKELRYFYKVRCAILHVEGLIDAYENCSHKGMMSFYNEILTHLK